MHHPLPRHCPSCHDVHTRSPLIVEDRKELWRRDGVEVLGWPPLVGRPMQGGKYCYTCSGQELGTSWQGARWHGKLYIFSYVQLPNIGDVVSLRYMTRDSKLVDETLRKNDAFLEKGFEYLVVEPFRGEPSFTLRWLVGNRKYTLKGHGRQWGYQFAGEPAVEVWRGTNSANSGRFGAEGRLIIEHIKPEFLCRVEWSQV